MPTFASRNALEDSLREAGLIDLYRPIAATLRPDLLLWRVPTLVADLPVGISRVGGDPDLPEEFAWPWRDPFDDVPAREAEVRRSIELTARIVDDAEVRDGIARREEARLPALSRRFPLAFVAQINLMDMALEAGFDAALPDLGLLSVFYDITDGFCGSPRLFWHDPVKPGFRVAPRQPPTELIDHYEHLGSHGRDDGAPVWPRLTHADRLLPVSGLGVPHHWADAGGRHADALSEWLEEASGAITMDGDDDREFHGDHLGGWPEPLQGQPEEELDDHAIERPGETRWRHVLSLNVGECAETTRLMVLDDVSDGQHYIFMDEDDLAARRFERAASTHQMT